MASIKQQLQEDLKEALKSHDKKRLGVLRLFSAAIKQYEVDTRTEASEETVLKIFTKLLKMRKESLVQFQKANRDDLAQQEIYEIDLIQTFLPKPLSEEELIPIIDKAITETNAQNIKDMKNVLALLSKQVFGKADMSQVSSMVRSRLQN